MYQNKINYQITSVQKKEIWSLEEVKNYLRVSHTNDDKLIFDLINSSISYAEQFLGIEFFITNISCLLEIASDYFRVKYIPVVKCDKVTLIKGQNKIDITNDFGYIDSGGDKIWIEPKYWHNKLEIELQVGWGDKLPRTIIQGMIMHIGMMYDFGENQTSILAEIKNLYMPYRRVKV